MRISRKRAKPQPAIRYRVNEQIRVPQVLVIDEEGNKLGLMPTGEAIRLAQEKELDLVEVSPKVEPPIAKILDFGKFLYQKDKEARKQKAKQRRVEIKGVRLSLRIGTHDKEFRLNQAKEFLEEGNRVEIEIILKGRERQYTGNAREMINQFINSLNALIPVKVEQPVSVQGGRISAMVAKK